MSQVAADMGGMRQIAFTSIGVALRHYVADMRAGHYHIHHGVIAKVSPCLPKELGLHQGCCDGCDCQDACDHAIGAYSQHPASALAGVGRVWECFNSELQRVCKHGTKCAVLHGYYRAALCIKPQF